MLEIDALFINGEQTVVGTTPVIAGFDPVISWSLINATGYATQTSVEIKVGTTDDETGTDLFVGDVLDLNTPLTANSYTFDRTGFVRGETYYAQIRSSDDAGFVSPWYCFSFFVNVLPYVYNAWLTPSPSLSDAIELTYTYEDTEPEDGTKILWFKNNVYQPDLDGMTTLPASLNMAGDSWSVKIVPSDGYEFGPVAETDSVTVTADVNDNIIVGIKPVSPTIDDILMVEYDSGDYGISGEISITWYLNNEEVEAAANLEYVRLDLSPNDVVKATVTATDGDSIISQSSSEDIVIADSEWQVINLRINDLSDSIYINDLNPFLEWESYKSQSLATDTPTYVQVLVTKTPSTDGAIYDSGLTEYTTSSFVIPDGYIERGSQYYIHVAVGDDSTLANFVTKQVQIAGSSWNENVENATGWTVETNVTLADASATAGILIHDGSYFCAIKFAARSVTFVSDEPLSYTFPSSESSLVSPKTFKIAAKGQNLKIWMNNRLVLDAVGLLTNESLLKQIEYGDVDSQITTSSTFRFFRYSTAGAYGFGESLPGENTYYFYPVAELPNGSIQYVFENLISWLPDDGSSKLFQFNENAEEITLATVTRHYSPITSIYVDEFRNKFIGTANGVTAIYGEKHDPDYELNTSGGMTITADQFDRMSTVGTDLSLVEPEERDNWFTINTTYEAVGSSEYDYDDPYDPYTFTSHAVHYYSQRTHGHAWFDRVDNTKGWQVSFSLNVARVESDSTGDSLKNHEGFGVYVNDGTYQEIIYFYENRIVLYYANVYVSITNTFDRDFVIAGKGQNLFIYQKLSNAPFGAYNKIIDGTGLFTTPASLSGNSSKSSVVFDSSGNAHAVWHDDGNGISQILYSKKINETWSAPELVTTSNQFVMKNPVLDVDGSGRIWVAYEDTSFGFTEIAVSVRDSIGWNKKNRITNIRSTKQNPSIKVDSNEDVHVVWEDNRFGVSAIFAAKWSSTTFSWTSSGFFGDDAIVMFYDSADPYMDPYDNPDTTPYGQTVEFRHPKLSLSYPRILIVAEAYISENNTSLIYYGYYDIDGGFWNSAGSYVYENGEFISRGTGTVLSNSARDCKNPSLASSLYGTLVTWIDNTDNVSQIWAKVITSLGFEQIAGQPITASLTDCTNPVVGWAGDAGVIVYESDNIIYSSSFNSDTGTFLGDATVVSPDDAYCRFPAIVPYTALTGTEILFDALPANGSEYLEYLEEQDYYGIYNTTAQYEINGANVDYAKLYESQVNDLDTKEFAFGDFSDTAGILTHWKDIKMYFGYDARPYSISRFNTKTVPEWPDDRVNDVFVDVFGNIISATFAGLVYHNVTTGKSIVVDDENLMNKVITGVKWGGNGVWFVGTNSGAYYSPNAGKTWDSISDSVIVNCLAVDSLGRAVLGTTAGVVVYDVNTKTTVGTIDLSAVAGINTVKSIAVDSANVIWAGTERGLVRIESLSNLLLFNRKNGMKSSHVNDICIVSKTLRYIATASGVEKMQGISFSHMNLGIDNDNVLSIRYYAATNSLWVGALHKLYEIVFRDPAHEIIDNEIVEYDESYLGMADTVDTSTYYVLDLADIQSDPDGLLKLTSESASVYLNNHKLTLGYSIDEIGQTVQFRTDLLSTDRVTVTLSNKLIEYHDFEQNEIERQIRGEKRTSIVKMARTSRDQLVVLSNEDNNAVMLLVDTAAKLPFTTILLDRDPPVGCLEKVDQVNRTQLKFRIYAYDSLSGAESYMLSNYENFTSDGTTPLSYSALTSTVVHDIGENLDTVVDSFVFSDEGTAEINGTEYTIGNGSALSVFLDTATNKSILYAGTSSPSLIFSYDPETEDWSAVTILDASDLTCYVTEMKTINNVIWVTTGTTSGYGAVYRSVDGSIFDQVASVQGTEARGLAGGSDGSVYFGSNNGIVYRYRENAVSEMFDGEPIGDSVYSLDTAGNNLYVATGNLGRLYVVNLTDNASTIIYSGSDEYIRSVRVLINESEQVFASSGTLSKIYRSSTSDYDFMTSYSTLNKTINKLLPINENVLTNSDSGTVVYDMTASVGESLYSFNGTSWQFLYRHNETILDFVDYSPAGTGVWVISSAKITKWSSVPATKTVYLKLKDKAGNETPAPRSDKCPTEGNICCDSLDSTTGKPIAGVAYSINITDIKNFVNEARIVDVDPYGSVTYSYNSPTQASLYSGDQIDEEVGVYTSEILNGSNSLVSWRNISWISVEPEGTSIEMQIRYASSESLVEAEEWSDSLDDEGLKSVSITHVSDQYLQFRAILRSRVRDISPSLSSVVVQNLTTLASHFFTTNFVLPSRPIKGLLAANTYIPVSSDIVFGINTNNSVDFSDYQTVELNRLFSLNSSQSGENLRIGAKLLSPNLAQVQPTTYPTEYDEESFVCTINSTYTNNTGSANTFHYRANFYSDVYRTQLIHTFFTGNDQTGWTANATDFPLGGISIANGNSADIEFTPGDYIDTTKKWYVTLETYYDGEFVVIEENKSFVCDSEYIDEYGLPRILNFGLVFELENGDHVKLNLQ